MNAVDLVLELVVMALEDVDPRVMTGVIPPVVCVAFELSVLILCTGDKLDGETLPGAGWEVVEIICLVEGSVVSEQGSMIVMDVVAGVRVSVKVSVVVIVRCHPARTGEIKPPRRRIKGRMA